MDRGYRLYGGPGTGAVAVEAALTLMGQPYELVDAPDDRSLAAVEAATELRQVPALVFPGGELMSESAAILMRLAELHPDARMAPGPDDPARGQYLRWMSFVASAVYAHFWFKDDPSRLVADASQHPAIDKAIEARISECWGIMERQVTPGRYILGDELSVLDLYVTVVSRFRPRRRRFYEAAPRMGEIVRRLDADPRLAGLWAERYPFREGWDAPPP
ncbi:MAG: glutathione S-transferase [Phenylobacterium sp.]|nr:glutathione S-transferase [Phenylobacterium sp.]